PTRQGCRERPPWRSGSASSSRTYPTANAEGGNMDILNHESVIRLTCFGGVLLAMALWELLAPRRRLRVRRPVRWLSNLGMVGLDTLVVSWLVPLGAVGMALLAQERGWGLFNHLGLPGWLAVVVSVAALDLVIYLQHVVFHAVPWLWRLHMVHHADLD